MTLTRQNSEEDLDKIDIWIYTDQPEFFEQFKDCPLRLHFKKINIAQIEKWKGKIDFVHRVKIEMLLDFSKDKQGQILYLDTDVYFAKPISEIFETIANKQLCMHLMEGLIHETDNVIFQKLSKFIKQNQPLQIEGRSLNIPDDTAMWNAGVLGFHTDYNYLLEDVLQFTDVVYPLFPKHVIEQFAFSFYFQNASPIKTAHTYIFHYWNLKEIRFIFDSFFNYFIKNSWNEKAHYSQLIQLPVPMQQKVNFLQNRTPLAKFMKKQWKPEEPRWELLVKQL